MRIFQIYEEVMVLESRILTFNSTNCIIYIYILLWKKIFSYVTTLAIVITFA